MVETARLLWGGRRGSPRRILLWTVAFKNKVIKLGVLWSPSRLVVLASAAAALHFLMTTGEKTKKNPDSSPLFSLFCQKLLQNSNKYHVCECVCSYTGPPYAGWYLYCCRFHSYIKKKEKKSSPFSFSWGGEDQIKVAQLIERLHADWADRCAKLGVDARKNVFLQTADEKKKNRP